MSDPGTTYRTREEVSRVRQERDPVKRLQVQLQEAGWLTTDDAKRMEKEIREAVERQVELAKQDPEPSETMLWTDVYDRDPTSRRGCLDYE